MKRCFYAEAFLFFRITNARAHTMMDKTDPPVPQAPSDTVYPDRIPSC